MKKVLLFSAVLVLLCFSALLPTSADAGSLVFDKMLFYESGYNGVEHSQRVYANRFPKSATRYINGEVNFVNYSTVAEQHKVVFKYYQPDGTLMGENYSEGTIKSKYEWETTWLQAGYGWETPGNYPVGQYRVEAYLDGVHVATNYFEIYDDTTQSVSSLGLMKHTSYGEKDGRKTYDLYYDKKITKSANGTVFVNIYMLHTAWGIENRIKDTPGFPWNAAMTGMIIEVNLNLNKYSVWNVMYADLKGNIISETKYDNPQWITPEKGTMAEIYIQIARELSK